MRSVLVIGAGVVGLAAAIRLREAGWAADITAREAPVATTSAVAAALWYPYRALPRERVTAWSARGYEVLTELAGVQGAGVRLRTGIELRREAGPEPGWRDAVATFERVAAPGAGWAEGWRFGSPVADMSVHLPWLADRLAALGGQIAIAELSSIEAALDRAEIVVNCAGLGAARLVGDASLTPVRGQVVYVEQVGVREWVLDQSDPSRLTYVVPREHDVVLGGSAQEGDGDTEVDPILAHAIVERCRALVPVLRDARVLGHGVGLRPARPTVRLQREGRVVHCYGHGGAGVTLAWGCAEDVVELVRACP